MPPVSPSMLCATTSLALPSSHQVGERRQRARIGVASARGAASLATRRGGPPAGGGGGVERGNVFLELDDLRTPLFRQRRRGSRGLLCRLDAALQILGLRLRIRTQPPAACGRLGMRVQTDSCVRWVGRTLTDTSSDCRRRLLCSSWASIAACGDTPLAAARSAAENSMDWRPPRAIDGRTAPRHQLRLLLQPPGVCGVAAPHLEDGQLALDVVVVLPLLQALLERGHLFRLRGQPPPSLPASPCQAL